MNTNPEHHEHTSDRENMLDSAPIGSYGTIPGWAERQEHACQPHAWYSPQLNADSAFNPHETKPAYTDGVIGESRT